MTKRTKNASAAVRLRAMKRDKFRCTYCGAPGTDAELEVDHIIPVSRGGSNHISNLTTACRKCNQKKGDSCPHDATPTVSAGGDWDLHCDYCGEALKPRHGMLRVAHGPSPDNLYRTSTFRLCCKGRCDRIWGAHDGDQHPAWWELRPPINPDESLMGCAIEPGSIPSVMGWMYGLAGILTVDRHVIKMAYRLMVGDSVACPAGDES